MKKTVKAFTLVEMLIVIVIIGILIASLMPRMQSAQWRARDVARKNDLAQIQTAIITSQQDRGSWPSVNTATWWMELSWTTIETELKTAWMTQVPKDPNLSNVVYWLATARGTWSYIYMVTTRNSVNKAWFILMAKTEVEWWSNRVTCGTSNSITDNSWAMAKWWINKGADLQYITTCTSFKQDDDATKCGIFGWSCVYKDISELRYILVY